MLNPKDKGKEPKVTPFHEHTKQLPKRYAWAPGNYKCTCLTCNKTFSGGKTATMCQPCAYYDWNPTHLHKGSGKKYCILPKNITEREFKDCVVGEDQEGTRWVWAKSYFTPENFVKMDRGERPKELVDIDPKFILGAVEAANTLFDVCRSVAEDKERRYVRDRTSSIFMEFTSSLSASDPGIIVVTVREFKENFAGFSQFVKMGACFSLMMKNGKGEVYARKHDSYMYPMQSILDRWRTITIGI